MRSSEALPVKVYCLAVSASSAIGPLSSVTSVPFGDPLKIRTFGVVVSVNVLSRSWTLASVYPAALSPVLNACARSWVPRSLTPSVACERFLTNVAAPVRFATGWSEKVATSFPAASSRRLLESVLGLE